MLPSRAAWCLLLLLAGIGLSAQQYDLRNYSLEQGLPSAMVNAICEDTAGYLLIGTNEGISRTDGIRFHNIGMREGLPNDDITALQCAHDGDVWVGCRNGAVVMLRDLQPHVITPGDPYWGAIEDIRMDGEEVWIATTQGGIWKYSNGSLTKDDRRGLPSDGIRAFNVIAGIAVCGTDSGLFVARGSEWIEVDLGADRAVLSLWSDDKGLLVGTNSGYVELDPQLKRLAPEESFTGHAPIALPNGRILAILRDRLGDIWMGTSSGVLHLTHQGGQPVLRQIRETNGLGHDLVRVLFQDRSGAVWCGTGFGGVSRFISDVFMHFTERDGLRSRIVSAVHRTPDGTLWFATAGGGISAWIGGRLINYGKDHGLDDDYVLDLEEDAEGFLLAATANNGVFRWNGDRFEKFPLFPANGKRINVIERDHQGRIWIGDQAGLRIGTDEGVKSIPVPEGVFDIHIENDTAWIASPKGLFFLQRNGSEVEQVKTLKNIPLRSMARDEKGNLWIGSDGHGLLRLNGSRLDSVTTDHNSMGAGRLTSNTVEAVLLDAFQNVWAGTRRGVHSIELDMDQEMILDIRQFGVEDGFIGIETFRNATMLDLDSSLWFGTLRGATRYDPSIARPIEEEPKVHLTNVQLFFENVDWSRWSDTVTAAGIPIGLTLPHTRDHLTFEFTGISLAYPERVRYRYILEGLDPDWSPITTTDRVIYSNIPPGDYIFKVLARNASGIWTEQPLEFKFTIVAPLWQRTWFQIMAVLLLISSVWGFIRYREVRSRREQRRLTLMVDDRTRELALSQQRSDSLLLNILPRSTAEELKHRGAADTRHYENCTVLFSDFTGFTSLSSKLDGQTLVKDLDHFFRLFDRITDEYGVEKIKTIGDAYMCACGIPEPKPSHALDAVLTAMRMMDEVQKSNAERRVRGQQEWEIRIGIHSGPIVAGVVGEKKFAYDIWGNTVNLASRMESNGDTGRINISGATYAQVMDFVEVLPRGPIKVRGKGEVQMYFVQRLRPVFSADQEGRIPNEKLLAIRQEMLMLQEF
jgi:class 3 adenylate cyclase/ligand-binding sensor domain-containing protein